MACSLEGLTTANTFDADAAVHWPAWQGRALPGHDGHAFTAPVGSLAPNAFGLYDMLGNVRYIRASNGMQRFVIA